MRIPFLQTTNSSTDMMVFRAFIETHQKVVFQLCYLLVGNKTLAEKTASDVFVQMYRHNRFQEVDRFSRIALYQYLHGHVQNSLIKKENLIRKDSNFQQELLGQPIFYILLLPIIDRFIFGLTYICSLSINEITEILAISKQQVQASLQQSRELLVEMLDENNTERYYEVLC
ncbi:RNA polymerase sigma factor [Gracilibacillus thailandensis]|uniref:Sigma-70 family RNA polymerase sigma factor n=1 Tax=Gracilibacillus thailandensis TaxID=563735 RepID=A0A6N7QUG3_9BACI|nr:sigma-70 family RNA polymerase sigma factor [Gracilibacillus thailandensis]MRI64762.1 hypothetical protein [Gracilibacillus thailandensis]